MSLAFFCPTLKGAKKAALLPFGFALFSFLGFLVFGFVFFRPKATRAIPKPHGSSKNFSVF